ncbi:MAG TPA: type VI secretion system baseplate subunit TssE [Pyrinomonadaceae bacterium]|nr:type VI secretion system baseplate subunit TssE [Pyrinomonadaceae bacterium]
MRDPKPIAGGRALLFERLVDDDPQSQEVEARPFRALDTRALRESVRRELSRLLNTRCHVPVRLLAGAERGVTNYGLPDFSSLSSLSGDDCKRLGALVAGAVAAFEPRLGGVRVEAKRAEAAHDRTVYLRIEAVLETGLVPEPVSFRVRVKTKTGEAEVDEDGTE